MQPGKQTRKTKGSNLVAIANRRLTETEAAMRLGLSARTLQQWRLKGGGPPFLKLGAAVRYDEDTLKRWEASRTRANTSDPGPAAA